MASAKEKKPAGSPDGPGTDGRMTIPLSPSDIRKLEAISIDSRDVASAQTRLPEVPGAMLLRPFLTGRFLRPSARPKGSAGMARVVAPPLQKLPPDVQEVVLIDEILSAMVVRVCRLRGTTLRPPKSPHRCVAGLRREVHSGEADRGRVRRSGLRRLRTRNRCGSAVFPSLVTQPTHHYPHSPQIHRSTKWSLVSFRSVTNISERVTSFGSSLHTRAERSCRPLRLHSPI